jgi:hypothetical protein
MVEFYRLCGGERFLESMTGVLPRQIFGNPPDWFYLNQLSRLRIDG